MPKVGQRFNPHRLFDGVFIPEAICKYKGISPGAKLAYGRFCRYSGSRGEVFPSLKTLGEEIGCGTTQARSYARELVEVRLMEVEMDPGKSSTYYFLWHPAFDGEVGAVRFRPLQDAGGVETDSDPLQDAGGGVVQDAGGLPLQDAGDERESGKESQGRESIYSANPETQNPFNPETLTRLLVSRLKRLRGVRSLPAPCKAIVATCVQRLDGGQSEDQILAALDAFEGESFWREYETPHKVRAFFKYLEDSPAASAPPAHVAPAPLRVDPAGQLAAEKPTEPVLPEEALAWNLLVPHASPVEMFSWAMPEGEALARCRRAEAFTPENWGKVCRKCEQILAGGNSKAAFLGGFQWVTGKDVNWWKVLSGGYDHMIERKAGAIGGSDKPEWLVAAQSRREAKGKQEGATQ